MLCAHVAGFRPSHHGFHFGNSWPRVPVLRIGPLPVGNAAGGLCGGLAFAARDFFEAGLPIPSARTNPAPTTPLFRYLVRRLFDSFDLPRGVLRYYLGQLPLHDPGADLVRRQWPTIRGELEAGRLVCLGIIRVRSLNPAHLGHHHQVLAHGYVEDDRGRVSLALYDPNHHDADDVRLSFSVSAAPDVRYAVGGGEAGPNSGERTYGAFVQRYTPPTDFTWTTRTASNSLR